MFASLATALVVHSQVPPPTPASFNTVRQIDVVAPDPTLHSLSVVSWNIGRGEHLNTIASELQRNPADLCLLQEVDWNTARAGDIDEGAELVVDGRGFTLPGYEKGFFIGPTLFDHVTPGMKTYQE